MLRFGLAVILVSCSAVSSVVAQSESATTLAAPPIRGARYEPVVPPGALPRPSSDLPAPSSYPALPAPGTTLPPVVTPTTALAPDTGSLIGTIRGGGGAVDMRMLVLDQHLSSLGVRRSSGIGGGVVSMLLGGAYIGLGVYANRNGAPQIAKFFYISGVASVLDAGVGFALQTNAERAYTEFSLLRDDATLSPTERLRRSEDILHRLARRRMASRFAHGGISLAVTAISLPFLFGSDGFDKSSGYDWIVTASAIIGVAGAVTTMVQRTEEERRWRMYQRFAASHGGDQLFTGRELPRLRLQRIAVSPIPGGGFAGASFIF